MTSLATKAARRLVMSHAHQYEPQDPFYEFWTDNNGKQKRRKVRLHSGHLRRYTTGAKVVADDSFP